MISNTTTIKQQKMVFWAIVSVIVAFFVMYGYFVSKSITNVLLREEVEENILVVNSKIGELEFMYLEQKNDVSLDLAHSMGFHNIEGKEFVARKSVLGQQLTLNNEI